jgi:hypothetical protein
MRGSRPTTAPICTDCHLSRSVTDRAIQLEPTRLGGCQNCRHVYEAASQSRAAPGDETSSRGMNRSCGLEIFSVSKQSCARRCSFLLGPHKRFSAVIRRMSV